MIGINYIKTPRLEDVGSRYSDAQVLNEILRVAQMAHNYTIEQDKAEERINALKKILERRK